jgi:hypothetical protein
VPADSIAETGVLAGRANMVLLDRVLMIGSICFWIGEQPILLRVVIALRQMSL